jgi:lysophospholipase L1-like esterase
MQMFKKLVVTGLLLAGWGFGHANAATLNVFLAGGQSNTDGRADSRELPEKLKWQEDVIFYANSADNRLTCLHPWTGANGQGVYQFGPEITFGRSMADYYAAKGEKVALLKFAAGGTNLYEQWKADGTADAANDGRFYQEFQKNISRGLEMLKKTYPDDTITIRGMIWMQGESDADNKQNQAANGKYSSEYGQNLTALINDLRLLYGTELRFVIGELSTNQKGAGSDEYLNNVRKGQEQVAKEVPLTGIVNTDGFSLKPDRLHFDAKGQQDLGEGFAKEMRRLLQ